MNLFFTTDIRGDFAFLHDEEAKHCAQVLRKKPGDAIYLVDGRGGWYEGILDEVNKREVCVKIVSAQSQKGKRPASIHLAIAPTKNMDRFEWFLEKCTELGIDEITPLQRIN
jgi:16S rRNA (uracil1498-N3)-methyltransferase